MKKKETLQYLFVVIYGTVLASFAWIIADLVNFVRIGFFVFGIFLIYMGCKKILRNVSN